MKIKIILKTLLYFGQDLTRYLKFSSTLSYKNNETKLLGRIIAKYHVIEKGLTMPKIKLGFGRDTIWSLTDDCINYCDNKFELGNLHFVHALCLLLEYLNFHRDNNYQLDEELTNRIKILTEQNLTNKSQQMCRQTEYNKSTYFQYTNARFKDFALSRHSVRNFSSKQIDRFDVLRAIEIAQSSPSACNRQPNRVYLIENEIMIKLIMDLQNGNRGFGHLIKKLLIVTSELGMFSGFVERNDHYVNGGIFAMTLLYGLHHYNIGTVPLNWCSKADNDKKLRKLCQIPDSEVVIMLIGCGSVPDNFKVALSPRESINKILRIFE